MAHLQRSTTSRHSGRDLQVGSSTPNIPPFPSRKMPRPSRHLPTVSLPWKDGSPVSGSDYRIILLLGTPVCLLLFPVHPHPSISNTEYRDNSPSDPVWVSPDLVGTVCRHCYPDFWTHRWLWSGLFTSCQGRYLCPS